MDIQTAFNISIGLVGFLGGWLLRMLWIAMRDLQEIDRLIARDVKAIEILVAGNYATRMEVDNKFGHVTNQLTRIEDKLDSKEDRRHGL